MWTLTSDNLTQAKTELNGRRAAVEARYAAELKAIDTDLEEIETLERVAHSFRVKRLSASDAAGPEANEGASGSAVVERDGDSIAVAEMEAMSLAPAAAETTEPEPTATGITTLAATGAIAQLQPPPPLEEPAANSAPKAGSSRWRIRIPSDGEKA